MTSWREHLESIDEYLAIISGAVLDGKLQIDGISGSGQVTIDDELVSIDDEIVIYV